MKNFRFYAELPANRGSKSASKRHSAFTVDHLKTCAQFGYQVRCIAVYLDDNGRPIRTGSDKLECLASEGVFHQYANTSASPEYLRKRATRISEELARKLSPALFDFIA